MAKRDRPDILMPDDDKNESLPRPSFRKLFLVLGLFLILFILYHDAAPLYTDWLWFQEVGYSGVFTTTIVAKTLLFCAGGLLFFALFYGNARLARRLAPEQSDRFLMERFGPEWGASLQRAFNWIILGGSAFLSLWAGRLAADDWTQWLAFRNAVPFHRVDPVFGNDIGFYVFRLPFLNAVVSFALGTLVLTLIGVLVIHVADTAIDSFAGLPDVKGGVRTQLLTLVGAIALVQAIATRLDAYELLFKDNGIFTGAGYTDLHFRLFALNVQVVLLVLAGLACLLTLRRGPGFRWPLIAASAWLGTVLVLGMLVPGIVQKTFVEPNQFIQEQEYLRRNIAFSRQGFGLENVRRVDNFPANNSLTAAGVQANRDTLDNVRLWDYDYLGKVYSQLQTIKPYYKFEQISVGDSQTYNIDIDRYLIGGKMRQVMLAAREMDTNALPAAAKTWQNQRLGYTHGYGLTMSPVNKILDGAPDYFLSGLPVTASAQAPGLNVTQPDIYYGLLAHDYVFTDAAQQEFDYPATEDASVAGSQDRYNNYRGKGGIRIGDSELRKTAFSIRFGDANVLLAKNFTPNTRVLFHRDIRDRLQTIAPFVQQDADPYLIVDPDDGRLVWMIDCYTMSDRYPYATPQEMAVNPVTFVAPNYIRNSIKATVDAYDGTVKLYLADPNDPVALTYSAAFPGLLRPLAEMPTGLRAHLRYPEDLFRIQRSVYASYHVDDPRVFYLKEDAWAIPIEPTGDQSALTKPPVPAPDQPTANTPTANTQKRMEPYYVIMRLPEAPQGQTEFLLMSPLSPINREAQNILGWMCARCDPEHYGELVLYRFPQSASVAGPSQIVQLINSDRVISPQLSLLRQGGSSASLGNLLVIPVEKSLLYIAPLYVESNSQATKLPQLQKVIVAFGGRAVMEDTLERALASLFPGGETTPTPSGGPNHETPPPGPPSNIPVAVRSLIERASTQYDLAQTKLAARDLVGYATAMKEFEKTLADLRRASRQGNGSLPGSPPSSQP
jgi:uncharacterized membrane protein (UPF0182 family)